MKHRFTSLAFLAVLSMLAACGKKPADTSGSSGSAIDTAQLAPGAPASSEKPAAPANAEPVVTNTAVIATTMGDIVIELYGKDAPKAVENFIGLARKHYFDGLAFHRVVPDFVIQTGDPNSRDTNNRAAWGTGGESIYGKPFEDELDPSTPSYQRGYVTGTVAMANSGPNTNGSQFFIVLSTDGAAHLQHNYTIFGAVRAGMESVTKIGETGAQGEMPLHPAHIRTVTIQDVPAATPKDTTAASASAQGGPAGTSGTSGAAKSGGTAGR